MTLIKSISGIRGTIGGAPSENLTPQDLVKFTTGYAHWLKQKSEKPKVVVGRDARLSGEMVSNIVVGTLLGCGVDVVDLGLSTTPTVELAVPGENAQGGIIFTASHNPKQWNALKLLNHQGEFVSKAEGELILEYSEIESPEFAEIDHIGSVEINNDWIQKHIDHILELPEVDVEAISKAGFKIMVDGVNSSGGVAVPQLLRSLGVSEIAELYCEPTGRFPHNPEPLPENLTEISGEMKRGSFHLGIVVDPDVDRLCFVCENGEMFGEEYTLVAVADYLLSLNKGSCVSNLSSTRALRDVAEKHGVEYHASAVGEVNVVTKMKEVKAVIGGEGNGGIIFPKSHYGRDALVGIALFLTHLAKSGKSASGLRFMYPNYHISKNKIELTPEINLDQIFTQLSEKYSKQPQNTIDGLKIEFDNEWVHLRKSNTEPIIRIYSEGETEAVANTLAVKFKEDIKEFLKEG